MFPLQDAGPGLLDDEVLDEYLIPFGSWIEESVNWTTLNLGGVLDAIAWPFEFLLGTIVDNFLLSIPWIAVVAIMFVIAWLVRNLTVATGTAVGLVVCGLLGDDFWVQTARTIGFILVAVIVCVIIGIPLGILSGRFDGVWRVMRPTLDAMQVIHAFVYLLPFVYFWGVGRISATMATMVFALPPLIRLTNLGIRQVPEDVVEASRAYGATELRVLRDVQLPLARPAIMTGINQTLLLAFSMLGIAAILGAGGLGQLLFRALGQQDVNLAAAAGLGFFLLAVILDRISQTEAGTRNLFSRMRMAWKARSSPEQLLGDPDFDPSVAAAEPAGSDADSSGRPAPIEGRERALLVIVIASAVVAAASTLATWAVDGAGPSAYARRDDADLVGASFSGLSASGGSWFAFVLVGVSAMVVASALSVLMQRSSSRWLSADGAALASLAALGTVLGYVLARPSAFSPSYSLGIGAVVALAATIVGAVASLVWLVGGPYSPRRPLRRKVGTSTVVLAGVSVGIAIVSMVSMWHLDERGGVVMTPEILAEIDDLKARAEAGEVDMGVAASEIQVIRARAQQSDRVIINGISGDGVGLGWPVFVMTVLGAAGAVVAAGVAGLRNRRRWIGGTVAMGLGLGVTGLAVGYVGTLARVADRNYYSGVGAMFAMFAGLLLVAAGSGVIKNFERSRVYASVNTDLTPTPSSPSDGSERSVEEEKSGVAS
ncbi:MAG: ABC transporter permease subunit [Actinomycetota bacterium]|jgi:glycine betaine/proline transport system permease protein|nr:ABC transporter permease subunit [Actinomycetota bacterium]MDA3014759.1 ABC transporter permease subunit [Actinomycetota bacterium]MDA3028646.1 ABC transporter permease subunit [Actinomycetota bacterium]